MENKCVQEAIPAVTTYMLRKARNWREKRGIWPDFDPYTRSRLSPSDVQAALEYFTKNELECSRQSPYKKDVASAITNGQTEYVSKLFMTR
ncbi:hypothetical protein MTO96_030854 [Rhipicephalus appendiculatus]